MNYGEKSKVLLWNHFHKMIARGAAAAAVGLNSRKSVIFFISCDNARANDDNK